MTHADPTLPPVRTLPASAPLQWLALGWHDLRRAPWLSLAHGLAFVLGGIVITAIAGNRFWLLAGAFSGFLLVAPVLATGLYAISRALEQGQTVTFSLILGTWLNWHKGRLHAWDAQYWSMVRFGIGLALAATGWVLTSAALITLASPVPIHTPSDFVQHVVLAQQGWLFELWLAVGGMMAAPVFASTAVTMQLLLDRRMTVFQAVVTSWQAVLDNPQTLALWAALIMVLTLVGFATALLGLVVVVPLLGHASWHAYRALVDASQWPARD
ncbi:DUF2189 domain-containing protein [Curvibacter sp. APW13]|uniref:DUF2189 domain-containing protein n=1 Tax=Curvibacter sp. APW13 TaxID=3077236 RepID=UPI0028DE053A|nr:DUF2189 domain-containing protein [Curvibacter sp. APW13]MDT8990345.1 DUF2189 domain-containing protein [Curvibacter sp. APW13]